MERFTTPAGRLSTIFYSTDVLRRKNTREASPVSDEEKSPVQDTGTDDAVVQGVRTTANDTIKSVRRRFAWKDLCLDIQVGGEHRRLLSNVSGTTTVILI